MSSLLKINNFFLVLIIILISFSSVALSQNSQITVIKRNNYTDTNYWWLDNNNFGRTNSNLELNGNFQFDHLNSTYKINFFSEIDNENNLKSIYLNESFIKYKFSDKSFIRLGRYYRDFSSYLNDKLSSGSMLISHNAQAMPKIGFVSSKKIQNNINFNYGISHGVFDKNETYDKAPFLHEKFIYINIKKNKYKMSFGFVHNAMWSGSIVGEGRQPSTLNDFLRILIAADEKVTENTVIFPHVNALGNHLGIWDFFVSRNDNEKILNFYYQHFFEDTSGLRFRNEFDGLWGLEIKNYLPNTNFLIEYLDTTNTYEDSYYKHSIYTLGWNYKNYSIGNPFVSSTSNNPKKVLHVGVSGNFLSNYYQTILSRKINNHDSIKYKIIFGRNVNKSKIEIIFANNNKNKSNIGLSLSRYF